MTREEFIRVLDREGYYYKIGGDRIVVTHGDSVFLNSLETLPPDVEFRNRGAVYLDSLKTLPPDVKFENKGDVDLDSLETISPGVVFKNFAVVNLESLKTLPPDVKFENRGPVFLNSLQTISPGVEFNNGGDVYLESRIGGWFIKGWFGNTHEVAIEGVNTKMLLNLMIKNGVFI